ncbi:hypothetical protein B296_00015931 [Ensete ventricosum]|uniref:Uncharacterized protein n=1 Tax=Ensete ventricosum TaxID=4639 RepID=A0A426XYP2_ENSVE|nr:hypothetical protein B296_00015931 [Ensete ventricosum]
MGKAPGSGLGGRLLEWWSSGRVEMFQLGSAADSCKKVKSGAVIAIVTGYPYLKPLYPLLFTIPLHLTTSSVVLANVNMGTSPRDLAERVNSGTNPRDLAEKVNSGISPGDLVERMISDTNPGDLVEKVNSGINPWDLAERVNSGTSPGDLAERVNSGTNP